MCGAKCVRLYLHVISSLGLPELLFEHDFSQILIKSCLYWLLDRLCGLVVRVSGYRYRGLGGSLCAVMNPRVP